MAHRHDGESSKRKMYPQKHDANLQVKQEAR
jgi:hypothetical protein